MSSTKVTSPQDDTRSLFSFSSLTSIKRKNDDYPIKYEIGNSQAHPSSEVNDHKPQN